MQFSKIQNKKSHMPLPVTKNSTLTLLAFASVYIIWGSTYLAIAYGLRGFPPFLLSCFRFFTAGMILLIWRWGRGESPGSGRDWLKNGIAGILTLTGATGLVTWGEQYISSAEAAIAAATAPFWFVLIDKKNWRTVWADKKAIAGIIIGFAGLLLFLQESIGKTDTSASSTLRITAFGVLICGSVFWVLGSLYSKHNRAGNSIIMNAGQQLIMAALAAGIISLFRGEWTAFHPASVPFDAWLGLLFLVVFGSVIAYLSYIWLIATHPPVIVSTHNYINPVVAVIVGGLFLKETMTSSQLLGMAVILLGVLLINASKYRINKQSVLKIRSHLRPGG